MNSQLTGDALYKESFCRNIGILSEEEQIKLKNSRIAIPGMGGVGGIYMVNLARIGISRFTISDPDTFDYSNINRQYGSSIDTFGENKAEVMKRIVLSINPSADIRIIEGGLKKDNIEDFLEGCDIVLDSLDAYNFIELVKLYQIAREKGLYTLKSIPFGFGATLLVFSPKGMSFTEFFNLNVPENLDIKELMQDHGKIRVIYNSWMKGYTPSRLYEDYLDPNSYNPFDALGNFTARPFPNFCPTVYLCGSLLSTEAVLILLNKRPSVVVPQVLEMDLYTHTFKITGPNS